MIKERLFIDFLLQ
ncbi:hypothetical protein YPPY58_0133, partial [Yersinia pestis PY-58]